MAGAVLYEASMKRPHYVANRRIQDYSDNPTHAKLCRNLKLGDILLTSSSTEVVRLIVAFQNLFSDFPPSSRKFTHVALYAGNGTVLHAMPKLDLDDLSCGGVEQVPLKQLPFRGHHFCRPAIPRCDGRC